MFTHHEVSSSSVLHTLLGNRHHSIGKRAAAHRLEEGLPKQTSVPWLQCIVEVLSHRRQPQMGYD